MKSKIVLIVLLVLYISTLSCQITKCFVLHRNIQIICIVPAERRTGISEGDCRQMCVDLVPRCQSVQYDGYKQQCDLFNTPSPLEGPIPVQEIAKHKAVYRAVREVPSVADYDEALLTETRNGITKGKCIPSVAPTIGISHYSVNQSCLSDISIPQTPSIRNRARGLQANPLVSPQSDDARETRGGSPLPPPNQLLTPVVEVLPIVPDCSNGELARVQIIDGVQIDAPADVGFVVDSPDACIHVCRTNSFLDGSRLPLLCRSAHYDRVARKCAVFPDALNPNGFLEYKPNPQVLYMEKICIAPSILSAGCAEIFTRIPQKVLVGHASDVATSSSQQDCVLRCLRAHLDSSISCRSVMHYPTFAIDNCILNFHTKDTRPEFFTPELRQKVDYVEIPNCAVKHPKTLHDGSVLRERSPSKIIHPKSEEYTPLQGTSFSQDRQGLVLENESEGPRRENVGYVLPPGLQLPASRFPLKIETINAKAPAYQFPEKAHVFNGLQPTAQPSQSISEQRGRNEEFSKLPTAPLKLPDLGDIERKSINDAMAPEDDSAWSEWASCDPASSSRVRFRVCSSCAQQTEFQPCFASNDFDNALQTFLKQNHHDEKEQDVAHQEKRSDQEASVPEGNPPSRIYISYKDRNNEFKREQPELQSLRNAESFSPKESAQEGQYTRYSL